MRLRTLIEQQFGPECSAADTLQFRRGRVYGWFQTDSTVWIMGLSADRNEARRVTRELRREMQSVLEHVGLASQASRLAYSDERSGFWVVGRPLYVADAA